MQNQRSAGNSAPRHYAAFISYRHLSPDQEIAAALHKMLEHNQVRPSRHVPRNIRPVFLDTGELPTLENLDAGIYQALENSDCLFVICSPNLPLSKYCMREIEYFKKIHGGRLSRIYTVLADGDPRDAFPDALRYEIRSLRGEDGVEREETTEVEPLFADVRAPSLRESLKKLKKKEYLRLAAAYYGCTFDALYKRHRRWVWKIAGIAALGAALVAAGFGAYAYYSGMKYDTAKAATYASYAEEQTQAGDELLAITLAREGWDAAVSSRSRRYMTALRSAAVQHDYKCRALPVAPVASVNYESGPNAVFYLSKNGNQAVTLSDYILQINDTKTGALCQRLPKDTIKLPDKKEPAWYVSIGAEADENGVLWDTAALWSIEGNRLMGSFRLRQSGLSTPAYSLVTAVETHAVYTIKDHEEPLGYISEEGQPLTREEAVRRMLEAVQTSQAADAPFHVSLDRKEGRRVKSVKNSAEETVLFLETNQAATDFSPDWDYFGCVENGRLRIYETGQWRLQADMEWDGTGNLYLLKDSPYVVLNDRDETGRLIARMVDWRTGSILMQAVGYVHESLVDQSFYCDNFGTWVRYRYQVTDSEEAAAIAQRGGLCLALGEAGVRLLDTDTGKTLIKADGVRKEDVKTAGDLSRVLIRSGNRLACYDSAGTRLWDKEAPSFAVALAADGRTAVYLDADGAHALDGADGAPLFSIRNLDKPENISALAVSRDGLCAAGWEGAVWYPADGGTAVPLGEYDSACLYADGLLFLQNNFAYVSDFSVWDTKAGRTVYQPRDNTGPWAYHAASGWLVRQIETSGNHETWELEVLRRENGTFESRRRIAMPALTLSGLRLDSSGEYLSLTAEGVTQVYRLKDLSLLLSAEDCPLFYEAGAFRACVVRGETQYAVPFLEGFGLRDFALSMITGETGVRTLTPEEKAHYSFTQ